MYAKFLAKPKISHNRSIFYFMENLFNQIQLSRKTGSETSNLVGIEAQPDSLTFSALQILINGLIKKRDQMRALFDQSLNIAQTLAETNFPKKIRKPSEITSLSKGIARLEGSISTITLPDFQLPNFELQIPPEIMNLAQITYKIISGFDRLRGSNPDERLIFENIVYSLIFNQRIELVAFSCPQIEPAYLSLPDGDSSCFISHSAEGSFILRDLKYYQQLLDTLYFFGIPARLTIILGDNDEEAYIFPVTGKPNDLEENICNKQMQKQLQDLQNKFNITNSTTRLVRWTDFMQGVEIPETTDVSTLFSEEEIEQETERMQEILGEGYYKFDKDSRKIFANISEEQLAQMVKLKLRLYSKNGIVITKRIPFAIGIQNERPPLLRTKMYNVLLKSLNLRKLPFIYQKP